MGLKCMGSIFVHHEQEIALWAEEKKHADDIFSAEPVSGHYIHIIFSAPWRWHLNSFMHCDNLAVKAVSFSSLFSKATHGSFSEYAHGVLFIIVVEHASSLFLRKMELKKVPAIVLRFSLLSENGQDCRCHFLCTREKICSQEDRRYENDYSLIKTRKKICFIYMAIIKIIEHPCGCYFITPSVSGQTRSADRIILWLLKKCVWLGEYP
ncbi:hypothetical protein ACJX0J_021448 [Zea mays]